MVKVNKETVKWEIKKYDEGSGEADVIVSDSNHSILCFGSVSPVEGLMRLTQPCWMLRTFLVKDIYTVDESISKAIKGEEYYSYEIVAQKASENTARLGDIVIELDRPFPKDIQNGRFVHFSCLRIDFLITYRYHNYTIT